MVGGFLLLLAVFRCEPSSESILGDFQRERIKMNPSLRLAEPMKSARAVPAVGGQPRLAVIIVAYNSAAVLGGLLDSLPAGLEGVGPYQVIVVDNDSHDRSAELAATHPVGVKVISMGRNAGYAAAINAATATVGSSTDVLVLNPDMRLHRNSVRDMYAAFRDPSVGAVVPRILDDDGHLSYSIRREPSMVSAWSEALLGGTWAMRLGLGEIVDSPALYRDGGRIEWASGAIMLISAAARRAVGNWNEAYFLYSEEVDYLRRVRAAHYHVFYTPKAQVMHIGGDYQRSQFLTALLTANRIKYYRQYHNALASFVFRMGIIVGAAMRTPIGPVHRAAFKAAMRLKA
jgi:GT2 family glycosyltransferase